MQRMRNFIILRDVIAISMATITRQLRELKAEESGVTLEEDSSEEESDEEEDESTVGCTDAASIAGTDGVSIAGTDGASLAGMDLLASSISGSMYEPVYVSMSAPGPGARELGITFAIGTPTVRKRPAGVPSGQKVEVQAAEMNQIVLALESRAWNVLKSSNPDNIIKRFINDNVHPCLQSCVAIADDDQNIWRGDSKISMGDDGIAKSTKEFKVLSKEEKKKKEESLMAEQTKLNINKGHVLPFSIKLRPVVYDCGPKDVFRCFFVDGELVGVTSYSPWAYYSDTYRLRDQILNAIKEFALSTDIRNFIHSYCNRANKALLKACGVLDKQGYINFDLLDGDVEYEVPADGSAPVNESNADMMRRRASSILHLSPGMGKRQSAVPNAGMARRISTLTGTDSPGSPDRKQSISGGGSGRKESVAISRKSSVAIERQLKEETVKNRQTARCTPLYAPPEKFLFKHSKYIDTPKLTAKEIVDLTNRYPFLKKSSAWKPGLVKAQNEMFKKKKAVEESKNSLATYHVRQLHASRLRVLNDVPDPDLLYGSRVFESHMVNVPGGLKRTPENLQQYFDQLSQMTIHTEVPIIDRVLRPKLQDLGELPKFKAPTNPEESKKGDRQTQETKKNNELKAAPNTLNEKNSEADLLEEQKQAEIDHSLNLELPPLNLMVIEAVISGSSQLTAAQKKKKLEKEKKAAKGKPTPKAEGAENQASMTRLKFDLHNVVGVFSCDREVNERAPPAVDCGLLDWNHILEMNDVASFEKEIHPLQWLVRPTQGNYFIPVDKGTRPWSHPGTNGVITHEEKLTSKKRFLMSLVGVAPDKDYLLDEIPRNIKTWLNM